MNSQILRNFLGIAFMGIVAAAATIVILKSGKKHEDDTRKTTNNPIQEGPDWFQWRGPRRDGVSTETGLLSEWPEYGPELLWNSKLVNGGKSIGAGLSSVSIAEGEIYTMGDHGENGYVFCLDEKTGKHVWETRISPSKTESYRGPRSTPTVDGKHVYALSRHGTLVCLTTAKGDIVWQKDLKVDFNGVTSGFDYSESPLVDGDKLVCAPGGDEATLIALNKLTGEVIWKSPIHETGGAGHSSIVIAEVGGIRQYIALLGKKRGLVGVNAADGRLLWNYQRIGKTTANIPTPIVKGDLVFASTAPGTGAVLLKLIPNEESIEAKEIYFLPGKTLENHHGGMVLVGDYIYGGHGHKDGLPFCLEMLTGKMAWGPERGPGTGSVAVVYADGHLYFRFEDNVMALVEATPQKYNIISQFDLPQGLGLGWPHPVINHGRLYIRGSDQLLCYNLKKK